MRLIYYLFRNWTIISTIYIKSSLIINEYIFYFLVPPTKVDKVVVPPTKVDPITTVLACCEVLNIPDYCLGLCTPAGMISSRSNRVNACTQYKTAVAVCIVNYWSKKSLSYYFSFTSISFIFFHFYQIASKSFIFQSPTSNQKHLAFQLVRVATFVVTTNVNHLVEMAMVACRSGLPFRLIKKN